MALAWCLVRETVPSFHFDLRLESKVLLRSALSTSSTWFVLERCNYLFTIPHFSNTIIRIIGYFKLIKDSLSSIRHWRNSTLEGLINRCFSILWHIHHRLFISQELFQSTQESSHKQVLLPLPCSPSRVLKTNRVCTLRLQLDLTQVNIR